jgi:AcrR family transcriptional regulator
MEHRTPRQKQKAKTKKALIAAALSCFTRKGFQDTSIGRITQAAGVAHGTFYVHFASKDALLDELLREFNSGLVQRLAPIWLEAGTETLPRRVHASAETFLAYWSERRSFVEAYGQKVSDGISLTDLRQGLALPVLDLLSAQLESLAHDLKTELPHAPLVVQSLLAMWARVGLHHLFDSDLDRAQASNLLTRLTLGALGGVLPAAAQPRAWTREEN